MAAKFAKRKVSEITPFMVELISHYLGNYRAMLNMVRRLSPNLPDIGFVVFGDTAQNWLSNPLNDFNCALLAPEFRDKTHTGRSVLPTRERNKRNTRPLEKVTFNCYMKRRLRKRYDFQPVLFLAQPASSSIYTIMILWLNRNSNKSTSPWFR